MNPFKTLAKKVSRIVMIGLAIVAACLACHDAHGQGRGLDLFKAPRIYDLGRTNLGAGGALVQSNWFSDIHGSDGISTIYLYAQTNQTPAVGTNLSLTATIFLSPDQTNWYSLTNYSVVTTNTTFLTTNGNYGGTNLICTNRLEYPFNWTVPTPNIAGFPTPYAGLGSWTYTNGGAITTTNGGWYVVGFDAAYLNAQLPSGTLPCRYVNVQWSLAASNFWNVGAILTTYSRQNYP